MERFEDSSEDFIAASANVIRHLRAHPGTTFLLRNLNVTAGLDLCASSNIKKPDSNVTGDDDDDDDEDSNTTYNSFPLASWLDYLGRVHRNISVVTSGAQHPAEYRVAYLPFSPRTKDDILNRLQSPRSFADDHGDDRGGFDERSAGSTNNNLALASEDFHTGGGELARNGAVVSQWNGWLNELRREGKLMLPNEMVSSGSTRGLGGGSSFSGAEAASSSAGAAAAAAAASTVLCGDEFLHSFLLKRNLSVVSDTIANGDVVRWLSGSLPSTVEYDAVWRVSFSFSPPSIRQTESSSNNPIAVRFAQRSKNGSSWNPLHISPATVTVSHNTPVATIVMKRGPLVKDDDIKIQLIIHVNQDEFQMDLLLKGKSSLHEISLASNKTCNFFLGHRDPPCSSDFTRLPGDDAAEKDDGIRDGWWWNFQSHELQLAQFDSSTSLMMDAARKRVFEPVKMTISHSRLAASVVRQQRQPNPSASSADAKKAPSDAPTTEKKKKTNYSRFELRNTHMLRFGLDFRNPPPTADTSAQSLRLR